MSLEIRFTRKALAYITERGWTEASTADHIRACVLRDYLSTLDPDDPARDEPLDPSDVLMTSVELEPGMSLLDDDDPTQAFWALRGRESWLDCDLATWQEVPVKERREQFPLMDDDGEDNFAPGGRFAGVKTIMLPRAFVEDEGELH